MSRLAVLESLWQWQLIIDSEAQSTECDLEHAIDLMVDEIKGINVELSERHLHVENSIRNQLSSIFVSHGDNEQTREQLAKIYRTLHQLHAYLQDASFSAALSDQPVGLAAAVIEQSKHLLTNEVDELGEFAGMIERIPKNLIDVVNAYVELMLSSIRQVFGSGQLRFLRTPTIANPLQVLAAESVLYKRSLTEILTEAAHENISMSEPSTPLVKRQRQRTGSLTSELICRRKVPDTLRNPVLSDPQRLFHAIFDELSTIPAASFNQDLASLITDHLQAIKQQKPQSYSQQFELFYHYFHNLYDYLKRQQEQQAMSGMVFELTQQLTQVVNKLVAKNPSSLENLPLYTDGFIDSLMTRLCLYAERVAEVIHSQLAPLYVEMRPEPQPLAEVDITALKHVAHERLQTELHNKANDMQNTAGSSVVMVRRESLTPPLFHTVSPSRPSALWQPAHATRPPGVFDKWQQLSRRKKWLFGSLIAIEIIGLIALGVFVPPLAAIAIPTLGVLNAKVLAVLLGAAAVVLTAAAVSQRANKVAASTQPSTWDSEMEVEVSVDEDDVNGCTCTA